MVTRSTPRTGYRQTRRKVTSPAPVIAAVDAAPRYGCRSLLTNSDSSQSVLRAQVRAQLRRAPAQSERSMRAGGGSTQELHPQVRRNSILQGQGKVARTH